MSESNPNRRAAAFFDLDRTLIDANSGLLYARREYRRGRISRWQMVQALAWSALYHLSLLDIETVFEQALSHYVGVPSEEIFDDTRVWFHESIDQRLQPGARRALDRHRAEGHPLVLLTNSSNFMATVSAEAWDLDGWLANHFLTDDDGLLTGKLERPLCYAEGKVTRAEAWAAEHGVDLDRSYFYSDSLSDVPMLARVGHPRVINPDPRLRRHAKRVGWPIVDWT